VEFGQRKNKDGDQVDCKTKLTLSLAKWATMMDTSTLLLHREYESYFFCCADGIFEATGKAACQWMERNCPAKRIGHSMRGYIKNTACGHKFGEFFCGVELKGYALPLEKDHRVGACEVENWARRGICSGPALSIAEMRAVLFKLKELANRSDNLCYLPGSINDALIENSTALLEGRAPDYTESKAFPVGGGYRVWAPLKTLLPILSVINGYVRSACQAMATAVEDAAQGGAIGGGALRRVAAIIRVAAEGIERR
jgi:hypothetical protein